MPVGRDPIDRHTPHTTSILAKLLDSGEFSDLIIRCGSSTFNVHQNIICTMSRPLAAHLRHGMLEAISGEIDLEDDDQEAVRLMIEFIYKGSYITVLKSKDESDDDYLKRSSGLLLTHTKVFIIADKFDIPSLRSYATSEYSASLCQYIATPEFVESLVMMYASTSDQMLRQCAVAHASARKAELDGNKDFEAVIMECPEFALDLYKYRQPNHHHPVLFATCPNCDKDDTTHPLSKEYRQEILDNSGPDTSTLQEVSTDYCTDCEWNFNRRNIPHEKIVLWA